MKKLIIAGAGQFGKAAAGLMNHNTYHLLAFGDNNPALWNAPWLHPLGYEVPILSMKDALALIPDVVLTGVIDEERTSQLISQIREYGYAGEIRTLRELYDLIDVRSATLLRLAERVSDQKTEGAVAELGVYKGDLAWKLNALFPDRTLYLFDTFAGFDERDVSLENSQGFSRAKEGDFQDTSMEMVQKKLPHPEHARFVPGFFPETTAGLEREAYAFVSIDADLYAPILAGLEYFLPRLSKGGMILLHDYGNTRFRGARQAVAEYEKLHGPLLLVPLCDLHGSAVILRGSL